ncbi:carbamate kinase [Parendozoicomonas haliclonae]|uniref:Carbamate kinase n=1 Tax=Parendozoicomonas haliclonae TaxID=1960125 RepID=A0A1X7AHP7_9GAMM|nr:carbamate kinase [Parendozoicomonas haliclonae]SMA43438.1 Carbamate kinase 2 [Parendozoicomonas haliclonae]
MLVVIALGGNAMLQREQPVELHVQRETLRQAADAIAQIAKEHQVVLTHANGPEMALLSLMNEDYEEVNNYPVNVLGAQTQGMIGFVFEQELRNAMADEQILAVTTHTLINTRDPAFLDPDHAVGPVFTYDQAQAIQNANPEWMLKADGNYFRRVVPSPAPQSILELASLRHIVASGNITLLCGGGGGIPVRRDSEGMLHGIPAVIDKDRTSCLLAEGIEADALVILTDADAIETQYQQPGSRRIKRCTPEALEQHEFAADTIGPKVESVCQFVRAGGKFAAIGALDRAVDILAGESGTHVMVDVPDGITYYD